uniref:Bm10982 n=1 Tax=Brugia malayi TaxID=6279 RepID=A0A0H5SCD5_BRUMA|nr:Bm10982 [Brugia malayi]
MYHQRTVPHCKHDNFMKPNSKQKEQRWEDIMNTIGKEQLKEEEQLYEEAQKEGFLHTREIGRDALFTLISNVQRLEQAIQTTDKEIGNMEPPTPVPTAPLVSQMQLPKWE